MQQGVRAHARFQRVSPRKARLVINLIRNMDVASARDQLVQSTKGSAPMVLKLLNSAVANAVHNNKLNEKDLYIAAAYVDEGPTLKRWRPRAFGRAAAIRKRTSHITIVVDAKEGTQKDVAEKVEKKEEPKAQASETKKEAPKKEEKTSKEASKKK